MTFSKQLKMYCLSVLLVALSPTSWALSLDAEASRLNFVTTKNDRIAELMGFAGLAGELDEETGVARIEIDLSSVDTGIGIRDSRMQELLFETARFPVASYTANIDMTALKKLRKGRQQAMSLEGQLDLHGKTQSVHFEVLVTRLKRAGGYHVVTLAPAFVRAADFELEGGIGKLKEIAKLGCIDLVVPVTFSVVFK